MVKVRFDWDYNRRGALWAWLAVRGHAADTESLHYINGIVYALAAYLENAKRVGCIGGAEISVIRIQFSSPMLFNSDMLATEGNAVFENMDIWDAAACK